MAPTWCCMVTPIMVRGKEKPRRASRCTMRFHILQNQNPPAVFRTFEV